MFIDVLSSVAEITEEKIKEKSIIVIDVLRATSTIVTALQNGADSILPVEHIEEAWEIYHTTDRERTLLGGERKGYKIEGFHLGNSPLGYQKEVVKDKQIILTTSNGTRAIKGCVQGEQIYIGSFLNGTAIANKVIEDKRDIAIVCAGTANAYSLDDALCAGMIISTIKTSETIDITDLGLTVQTMYELYQQDLHRPLRLSKHYGYLMKEGFQKDVAYCLQQDIFDTVPAYNEGKIILSKE